MEVVASELFSAASFDKYMANELQSNKVENNYVVVVAVVLRTALPSAALNLGFLFLEWKDLGGSLLGANCFSV